MVTQFGWNYFSMIMIKCRGRGGSEGGTIDFVFFSLPHPPRKFREGMLPCPACREGRGVFQLVDYLGGPNIATEVTVTICIFSEKLEKVY